MSFTIDQALEHPAFDAIAADVSTREVRWIGSPAHYVWIHRGQEAKVAWRLEAIAIADAVRIELERLERIGRLESATAVLTAEE